MLKIEVGGEVSPFFGHASKFDIVYHMLREGSNGHIDMLDLSFCLYYRIIRYKFYS